MLVAINLVYLLMVILFGSVLVARVDARSRRGLPSRRPGRTPRLPDGCEPRFVMSILHSLM